MGNSLQPKSALQNWGWGWGTLQRENPGWCLKGLPQQRGKLPKSEPLLGWFKVKPLSGPLDINDSYNDDAQDLGFLLGAHHPPSLQDKRLEQMLWLGKSLPLQRRLKLLAMEYGKWKRAGSCLASKQSDCHTCPV